MCDDLDKLPDNEFVGAKALWLKVISHPSSPQLRKEKRKFLSLIEDRLLNDDQVEQKSEVSYSLKRSLIYPLYLH